LMPLWKSRCFTLLGDIPSFSAISLIVKPSIYVISDILTKKLKYFNILPIIYLTHSNLGVRMWE
jgi:hypothetical protein